MILGLKIDEGQFEKKEILLDLNPFYVWFTVWDRFCYGLFTDDFLLANNPAHWPIGRQ